MRRALLLNLLVCCACTHVPQRADPAAAHAVAELFHDRVRWKDFRAAAQVVVPERREAFTKARASSHDERDLSVTDYELEGMELTPDGQRVRVTSRVRWIRLPSPSESNEEVTSEFVDYHGSWMLARQEGGPFCAELSEPYSGPPDAGTAQLP